MNNTIVIYCHPSETLEVMQSLKHAGVRNRHQQNFDKAEGLSIAVSKEQNDFRDRNNEKLSAKEKMKRMHLRSEEKEETNGKFEAIKRGLYCLMQTAYIFQSYRMIDRTPVIDNVDWPDCVKKELQKERIGKNQRDIVEVIEEVRYNLLVRICS